MSTKTKRNRLGLTLLDPSLTQRNDVVLTELPLIIQGYERLVQPDEIKLTDGTIIKKPQFPVIGPDNSTTFVRLEGERKYKDSESAKERQKGKERVGKVLNEAGMLIEPFDLLNPSRIYGAYDDWKNNRKGFLRSWREGNQGFGNEKVNFLVDFLAPAGVAKALKLGRYLPKANFSVLGVTANSPSSFSRRAFTAIDPDEAAFVRTIREPILPEFDIEGAPITWYRTGDQIEVPAAEAKRLLNRTIGSEILPENMVEDVLGERNIRSRMVLGEPIYSGSASEMEEAREAFRSAILNSPPIWNERNFANVSPNSPVVMGRENGQIFGMTGSLQDLARRYNLTDEDITEIFSGLHPTKRGHVDLTYLPENEALIARQRLLDRIADLGRRLLVTTGTTGTTTARLTAAASLGIYTPKRKIIARNVYDGEEPYKLEDLVDVTTDSNGNLIYTLKPDITFDSRSRSRSGSHGSSRWHYYEDSPRESVDKYFDVISRPGVADIKSLKADNPINRSGVLLETGNDHYSIDSMWTALRILEKNLKAGRKYVPLNRPNGVKYVDANGLGLKNRYTREFSDEFNTVLRNNHFTVPKDYPVTKGPNGELVIQNPEGKVMGKLIPRTNEDIINLYNNYILLLNDRYKINIPPARVQNEQIQWPELYGLLYKKGGTIINNFKNKMKLQKFFNKKLS